MHKDSRIKSFVFFSRTGCFLPLLIILNSLFGWIFLKPKLWLISETILIAFFIINGYIITRKIISPSSKRDDAIDVKGEVVEDKHKRKEILDER